MWSAQASFVAAPARLCPSEWPPFIRIFSFQEAIQMAYEKTRRVMPILAPIAALCLPLANCGFGCTPASDPQAETRAGLERQQAEHCKMTAKIQCPLQCNQLDFNAVCDANLGAGCDAQCDTSATGNCLNNCSADCALGCQANSKATCTETCEPQCADHCQTLCAGAIRPTDCTNTCKGQCHSMCGDSCTSDSDSSCDAKCGASCDATCTVEAHVACQLRCSVDAWTTCKATVQANCMAECSTDVMLSCGGSEADPEGADPDGVAKSAPAPEPTQAQPAVDVPHSARLAVDGPSADLAGNVPRAPSRERRGVASRNEEPRRNEGNSEASSSVADGGSSTDSTSARVEQVDPPAHD